jgi:hypothetical protein
MKDAGKKITYRGCGEASYGYSGPVKEAGKKIIGAADNGGCYATWIWMGKRLRVKLRGCTDTIAVHAGKRRLMLY